MTPEVYKDLMHIGKIAGVVAAVSGAFIGVVTAWPTIEPYVVAHRGLVRDEIAPLKLAMDRQAVATDRQTLFQLKEYLDRAVKDPAASSSPIVQERIRELKDHIKDTETRIRRATGSS